MTLNWECSNCKAAGTAEAGDGRSIYQTAAAIMRAHYQTSQQCELQNGCSGVHFNREES